MNSTDLTHTILMMATPYLPGFIVSLVAIIVCLTKWKQSPQGAAWALSGFGISLFLCIAMPIAHALLQQQTFGCESDPRARIWLFSVFALASAVLHALTYVLLLVAVFAGRPKQEAPPSNPFQLG